MSPPGVADRFVFPGFEIDSGFSTLLVALGAAIGFIVRNRLIGKRLAASLLTEVRFKLQLIDGSEQQLAAVERLVRSGVSPRLPIEPRLDVIFDNQQGDLTYLQTSVLESVIAFYKLDETMTAALEEINEPAFAQLASERQLFHINNIRTILLPRLKSAAETAKHDLIAASTSWRRSARQSSSAQSR